MAVCIICKEQFLPKNIKRPPKTCSKTCKNLLASRITIEQFSDPESRNIQRRKSLALLDKPDYKKNFRDGIDNRTSRWLKDGHPRIGQHHSDFSKQSIGIANTGRFKGKTWNEIYGEDVAEIRRIQNSESMCKKNEILLKDKRSNLETSLIPYLPDYKNNIKIGRYTVDFVNTETKHIIEVYGDYWHCNPKIYESTFLNRSIKLTAAEKQKRDKIRVSKLEEMGYTVTVVWESELDTFIKNF